MEKVFSSLLGTGLSVLALSGFAQRKSPKYFLHFMNVDTQHSVLRVPLAAVLMYAGSRRTPVRKTRYILSIASLLYLTLGIAGIKDKSIFEMLPSRLTNFDLVYHFSVGTLALWLGTRSGRMMK
jgi:hypothetical protein